jgi:hypothetical protein
MKFIQEKEGKRGKVKMKKEKRSKVCKKERQTWQSM